VGAMAIRSRFESLFRPERVAIMNSQGFLERAGAMTRRLHRRLSRCAAAIVWPRGRFRCRPRLASLEDRTLLSVFLVDTTADSGPGSLRQAIFDSNAAAGSSIIDFDIPGQGTRTIVLASPLPPITGTLLIDGTSQPGYGGTPLIQLSGVQASTTGLFIAGPSVSVSGVAINNFTIDANQEGLLTAQVDPQGSAAALSLIDSGGGVLVQSDGLSAADPDASINEHLAAGSYSLQVETIGGAGEFTLSTTLTPAIPPFQPLTVNPGSLYGPMAVGDFNGDGMLDIAASDGVHLGLGDGTFKSPITGLGLPTTVAENITAMVAGDFSGDGNLDLAVAFSSLGAANPGGVFVLMGNGNGTFQTPQYYPAGDNPASLVTGDFTGDGKLDLAVADKGEVSDGVYLGGGVSVLMGNGDGTFQPAQEFMEPNDAPQDLVAGDFTDDGRLDLAVANRESNNVSILSVNDDGMPQLVQPPTPVGTTPHSSPYSLVAGNFTGDGTLDLAVANYATGDVTILLGNGNGTFRTVQDCPVGQGPQSLIAGDFLGNGKVDLALVDTSSDEVSLLPGNGDGSFQAVEQTPLGFSAVSIVAGDFNGDGRLDLAAAGSTSGSGISVLLGEGDGLFQTTQPAVGAQPNAEAVGDFNGDGYLDVATADASSDGISILLGNGDGTFQPPQQIALAFSPAAIVAGDFNGDGRLDLAVAGSPLGRGSGEVAILLGNGDGTFQPPEYYDVGFGPTALVAADFTGNGTLDLAVANNSSDNVSILLGNGDGTFQPAVQYAVGQAPDSLVAGDFNNDGKLDLAVADEGLLFDGTYIAGGVSLLMGNGDGTFQPARNEAVGEGAKALVAGDFTGNGNLDLAVADVGSNDISVLLGGGNGTFQAMAPIDLGFSPTAIVAGEFTRVGYLDLAVAGATSSSASGEVAILLGNGDGTFQISVQYSVGTGKTSMAVGDFIGDGNLDLAIADAGSNEVSVLLGSGAGTFINASELATTPNATPLVADVAGDGTDDVLVVDAAGDILYRQGRPQQPGSFDPPVIVNPGFPSRDIAWVPDTDEGPMLASVDADDDAISLYAWRGNGFVRIGSLMTGAVPAQIIAADLTGDGWDDLVVRDAGDGTLSLFLNEGNGPVNSTSFVGPRGFGTEAFGFLATIPVGLGVSDVEALNVNGAGPPDLVVTNKLTGQLSVLINQGHGTFASPAPYRAATGLSEVDPGASPGLTSLDATAGVAAGPLTAGGPSDLVTINPGSNTMDILAGLGQGRFANPVSMPTQDPAQAVCIADFNGDGLGDLAILTAAGVTVYLGNPQGGFSCPTTYAVAPDSTGLTVADIDGHLDLLVGDSYGDVLVLVGEGNGKFQTYQQVDQSVELAVADLTGNGSEDVIYANQDLDQVTVDYGVERSTVLADQATGLLDPGAVQLAYLAGPDAPPDLIVANSGGNDVLIYPGLGDGLGNGQFGPEINGGHGYFVGTDPVGITVADLTGDLPDLVVADEGSDQVSILFNQSKAGGPISFTTGPRLNSGGSGPVSTVVENSTSPFPDILVTNSGSNDVALLPGVGQGFFNDQGPRIYSVGSDPVTSFVGNFNGQSDLLTVDAGSNDLTLISDFSGPNPTTTAIASGGLNPVTAFEFNSGNGFEDLVVGNSGDATLALFQGGPGGLNLFSTEDAPSLPDLTSLAFLAVTAGQVQFLAATAGVEPAQLFSLSLDIAVPPVVDTILQLVPLRESSPPLLATLVSLTIAPTGDETNLGILATEVANLETVPAGTALTVGQGLSPRYADQQADGEAPDSANELGQSADLPANAASPTWERLFLGLDDILEELRVRPPGTSAAQDGITVEEPSAISTEPASPIPGGQLRSSWHLDVLERSRLRDWFRNGRKVPSPGAFDPTVTRPPTEDGNSLHSERPESPIRMPIVRVNPGIERATTETFQSQWIERRIPVPLQRSSTPERVCLSLQRNRIAGLWPLLIGALNTGRIQFTRPSVGRGERSSRRNQEIAMQ
jgi:hypothetical protein